MKGNECSDSQDRRSRVSQADVPAYSLEQALRVPRAIGENYAYRPVAPLDAAAALEMSPTSSGFRMLCGSAIAYGLTEGGYNASQIAVLPLARRILEPTTEEDDLQAMREAALRPRVVREFLNKYNGGRLPREDIALNVLIQLGVPRDSAARTFNLIKDLAKSVGFLTDIKGQQYVKLQETARSGEVADSLPTDANSSSQTDTDGGTQSIATAERRNGHQREPASAPTKDNRRVFISHGKNRTFLEPLKDLLSFGELDPVVSVEQESVSQPVPDKVMSDMRSCGAAIIHVAGEQKLLDQDGQVKIVLNPNVLIEIGAAMALYGRRFILLVRDGTTLPSNLQGLYEVRYDGEKLDGDVTIRLLKAIREMKNHPPPAFSTQ